MNKGFDIIAPVYDRIAGIIFGDAIRKAQLTTIDFIPNGAAVLIIGGGTGWYLQKLLAKHHVKKIVYLESSPRMIALAQQKTAGYIHTNPGIVEFRLGTEANIGENEKYDVIITHFLLDLFRQPRLNQMMQLFKYTLKEKGILLFSDFVLIKTDAGYWWKELLLNAMYTFFRLCCQVEAHTLPNFDYAFSEHALNCIFSSYFFRGFITSRVYTHI